MTLGARAGVGVLIDDDRLFALSGIQIRVQPVVRVFPETRLEFKPVFGIAENGGGKTPTGLRLARKAVGDGAKIFRRTRLFDLIQLGQFARDVFNGFVVEGGDQDFLAARASSML